MKNCACMVVVTLVLVGCGKSGDTKHQGGDDAGTAGMAGAASGGMGAGGTGTGGTASANDGCDKADTSGTAANLHAGAVEVLAATGSSCGFMSCHVGSGKAALVLAGSTDLNKLLVDKASCEVPGMPLVDSHGGNAALKNSWLWQKLTAPDDIDGVLIVDAAWGKPGNCGQDGDQAFGVRMPKGQTAANSEAKLAKVRNWICAGAPAPK